MERGMERSSEKRRGLFLWLAKLLQTEEKEKGEKEPEEEEGATGASTIMKDLERK